MKKLINKILPIIFLVFFCVMINALDEVNDGVNVDFKVKNWGFYPSGEIIPEDLHIVGDFFSYEIFFKANENISDHITVNVTSPTGRVIHYTSFDLNLNKGENYSFIPSSNIKTNDTIALPFDVSGDYEIEICSQKDVIFYRWFNKVFTQYSGVLIPIWEKPCAFYFFSVISQTDYTLNKKQEEENAKNLEFSQNLLKLTKWLVYLTIILIFVELINLWSNKKKRYLLLYFVFILVPLIITIAIMAFALWLSYTEFGAPWNIIMSLVIIFSVVFFLKSKMFKEDPLIKKTFDEIKD